MKILVTGVAGFIGMHTAERLLARGDEVIGIDNLNDYYDPALKRDRLATLQVHAGFGFKQIDVSDRVAVEQLLAEHGFTRVIHLAAQAGVRHSLVDPHAYVESNLLGFLNILDACRHQRVQHLVYASSSSVYGGNTSMPFVEQDSVDHPQSLYAATKKANELMAHSYSHLYRLPTTGLRFFTVYGPWGRPDMAYFKFTRSILAGKPIDVFNQGRMQRDFTYIDDIVEGIVRSSDNPPVADPHFDRGCPDPSRSDAPYRLFNIGNHRPVPLMDFIGAIEAAVGRKARLNLLPMQPGDVAATHADVSALTEWTGFKPTTELSDGVARFVAWYRDYYRS